MRNMIYADFHVETDLVTFKDVHSDQVNIGKLLGRAPGKEAQLLIVYYHSRTQHYIRSKKTGY